MKVLTGLSEMWPIGVLVLEPFRNEDERGFLSETFSKKVLASHGFELEFVQENHCFSRVRGVVRGLHFQSPPYAQTKLVRVTKGSIFDVAVDIRRGSPTFGLYAAVELNAENCRQLLVPKGFAHGYCTLEPNSDVLYKITDYYAPESEGGILWNDPALRIEWPVTIDETTLSRRDLELPRLAELDTPFVYEPS
jgi:dTDP-4-dehydrorhamnose 3,5-epimerase